MRKIVLSSLALVLVFALVGCSSEIAASNDNAVGNEVTGLTTEPTEETSNMKEISVGETVSVPDLCEFVIETIEFTPEFSETDGSYTYSMNTDDESMTYLVLKLSYTNNGTEPVDYFLINSKPEQNNGLGTELNLLFDEKYKYDGHYTILSNEDISPLTTGTVYAYFEVPNTVETSTGHIIVTLDIQNQPYSITIR